MHRLITTVGWRVAGAPLLLLISLYGLHSHSTERQRRNEVLTHGARTNASVVKSSGIESVLVAWTDWGGQPKMADAWTGKPFARLARPGQDVAIKYLLEPTREPVILSEAHERDRVNEWWISTNAWVAIAMTIICAVLGGIVIAGKYHPRNTSAE